ncbi:MAG: HIRAN domain-containing protein [Deltaproteobacteria bacterium]
MNKSTFSPITTKLAGVTFGDCQAQIRKWGCADIGSYAVDREPDNPHDPDAVKVSLFGIHDMGYLPKDAAKKIAPLIDEGRRFLAEFVCRNECAPDKNIGLTVRIIETT